MLWKYRYTEGTRPTIYNIITHDDCEFFRKMGWQDTTDIAEHVISVHNPACCFENGIDAKFYYGEHESVMRHFDFLFAGAGDTRKTKALFASQEVREKIMPYIMNGLTMDDINRDFGGGKYACSGLRFTTYESLWFTGSRRFKDFDIDRCIVIKDLENIVTYEAIDVDATTEYVSDTMVEVSDTIEITDGAGMFLPGTFSDPDTGEVLGAFTARAPWFKGLMVQHDFMAAAKRTGNYIVKDAWGLDHNILLEGINCIWTTSQLKLWKAYKSWDHYKRAFKDLEQYFCVALLPEKKTHIILSYQVLQDLRATEAEVHKLLKPHFKKLWIAHGKVTGRAEQAGYNYIGTKKAIGLYQLKIFREIDAMLNTNWVRKQVRDYLNNEIKKIKYGKIRIKGREPFVSPDWNWVCNQLFGDTAPEVPTNMICCRELKEGQRCDIIRYPHLYTGAHCIRDNIYINGLEAPVVYADANGISSKLLEFDEDGDHLQLLTDPNLVAIAEKPENRLPPIHYTCSGGKKHPVLFDYSEFGVFTELLKSYGEDANVGIPSNWATKIYDDEHYDWNTKYRLVSMLAHTIQGCIDFPKAGVGYMVPSRLVKEFKNLEKPAFMKLAKEVEDRDRLESLNRREMIKVTREMFNDDEIYPEQLTDEQYKEMLIKYREIRTSYNDYIHYKDTRPRECAMHFMDWVLVLADEEAKAMNIKNWHAETNKFTSVLPDDMIQDYYDDDDNDDIDDIIIQLSTEATEPEELYISNTGLLDSDEYKSILKFMASCNNKYTIHNPMERINGRTMMFPIAEVAEYHRNRFYTEFPEFRKKYKRIKLFKKVLLNKAGTGFPFCHYLWPDELYNFISKQTTNKYITAEDKMRDGTMPRAVIIITDDNAYEYESQVACARATGIKRPHVNAYCNDGKKHKIPKLGCKGEFRYKEADT